MPLKTPFRLLIRFFFYNLYQSKLHVTITHLHSLQSLHANIPFYLFGASGIHLETSKTKTAESESESYVTTDGQSASLSWYKAPIRGLRPDFFFRSEYGISLTVTFFIPWGALSDERTGLSFVCAAGQRSLSQS
jgi:hypothetical protein